MELLDILAALAIGQISNWITGLTQRLSSYLGREKSQEINGKLIELVSLIVPAVLAYLASIALDGNAIGLVAGSVVSAKAWYELRARRK